MVSLIQSALRTHFESTLAGKKQPHTFNLQLCFLQPAAAGQAKVCIKAVKLGTKVTTVHVRLSQASADIIVGYAS